MFNFNLLSINRKKRSEKNYFPPYTTFAILLCRRLHQDIKALHRIAKIANFEKKCELFLPKQMWYLSSQLLMK